MIFKEPLQIDHVNKMSARFFRENGFWPTKLIAGRQERADIESWSYQISFPNTPEGKHESQEWHAAEKIYGQTACVKLHLIRADKESYLEIQ